MIKSIKSLKIGWLVIALSLACLDGFAESRAAEANITKSPISEVPNLTVKGKITDAKTGEPVIGASVIQKGTTNGVVTDVNGDFQFSVAEGAILEISSIGYKTIETAAKSIINIALEEDVDLLDEVLVVGYGTVFKKKTTSSIATVNAEQISAIAVPNVTQTLAGQAPGLIVNQAGGLDSKASISIRGGGTPLYVIDNVICNEREFQNINPSDIESMSILKDASSTAIYGARAANGIIMVTTKHGKEGNLNVDYSMNLSLVQPVCLPEKLNSYDLGVHTNAAYIGDGYQPRYSDAELAHFKNGDDLKNYPNTDWYEECLRKVAPEQRHVLSVSGGNDKIRAYTSLGYNNQNSIYKTTSHTNDRYTFRTNVDANFAKIGLKVGTSIEAYMLNYRNPSNITGPGGSYFYIFSHINNHTAAENARNQYGQPYGMTVDNPVVEISDTGGYVKSQTYNVKGGLNLEWSVPWVKGLKFKGIGSYTAYNQRYKQWDYAALTYDWEGNLKGADLPKLSKSTYSTDYFNVQALADYGRTIGDHTFSVTAGFEASGNSYDNGSMSRDSYIIAVDQINSGPSSTMKNSASEGIGERRASVIGRVRYDYKSKYMAEFNLRYDGSDYFPKDHRWGLFFSGSLAYAISEEDFWKNGGISNVFETFKLRASYGEIGLDNVDRYAYLSSYGLSTQGAVINGAYYPTFSEGNLPATEITWYKTKDFNVGLDFSTLSSRLSGSLDYFAKVTTGYLASPSNVGYTSPLGKSLPKVVSDGESIRRGFDLVFNWKDKVGDFTYGVMANYTYYDSRWNKNPDEAETTTKNPYKRNTQVGNYSGVMYHTLGYYKNMEDVMNNPKTNSTAVVMAGDVKIEDFNGDGKIDGDDQYRQGSGNRPNNMFGLGFDMGYKGLFANILFQGATNFQAYLGDPRFPTNGAKFAYQLDYWTPDNTDALFPRQHYQYGYNNGGDHRWVSSAYVRLKNIAIGYDFKKTTLRNCNWLSKLALSVSAYNLFTISPVTKYGYDPEYFNTEGYTYPVTRTFSVNLNIGF